jgi:hypothetical protein
VIGTGIDWVLAATPVDAVAVIADLHADRLTGHDRRRRNRDVVDVVEAVAVLADDGAGRDLDHVGAGILALGPALGEPDVDGGGRGEEAGRFRLGGRPGLAIGTARGEERHENRNGDDTTARHASRQKCIRHATAIREFVN